MSFIWVKEQSFYGCPGGEVGDGLLEEGEVLSFVRVRDPDGYVIGKEDDFDVGILKAGAISQIIYPEQGR